MILDDGRTLNSRLSLGTAMFLLLMAALTVPFSAKMAIAQVEGWVKVADTGPSVRAMFGMVYDSMRGVVLVHGGVGDSPGYALRGDTWEWDGSDWTLVSTNGPLPYGPCAAYDSDRGVAVVFGGYIGPLAQELVDPLPYTWEWDSNTRKWSQFDTTYMEGRGGSAMVYDTEHKRIIMHGGHVQGRKNGETWAWDGEEWTLLTADGPERFGHAMVYDSDRQKTVLFGGWADLPGEFPAESTWEFDGSEWTHVSTPVEPPGRMWAAFAFDSSRAIAVLFGGGESERHGYGFPADISFTDMWEWNGTEWREISTSGPDGRFAPGMAYDSQRKKIVLFGGSADWLVGYTGTWEYTAASTGMPRSLWSLH